MPLAKDHRGTPPTATFGNFIVAFPYRRLSGKWLYQCGFCIGECVEVSYESGKLVITLAPTDAQAGIL